MEDVKPLDGWVNLGDCLLPGVLYCEGMWHLRTTGLFFSQGLNTRW